MSVVPVAPDDLSLKAQAHAARRAGRSAEALRCFEQALAENPGDVEAALGRADTLRDQGRLDEAQAAYCSVLDAGGAGAFHAHLGMGYCASERGQLPRALERFRTALELEPANRWVRLGYADCLRDLGRADDAEHMYLALVEDEPAAFEALLGLAHCARNRGDLAAAAQYCERAVRVAPDHHAARLGYADNLRELGNVDEAQQNYLAVLAQDASSFHAQLGLGHCERLRRDLPAALVRFEAALALEPDNRWALLACGDVLRDLDRAADAEILYARLLERVPEEFRAHLGLGYCAQQRAAHESALAHFQHAVAVAPDDPSARLAYADSLREAGRADEAECRYRELLAQDPGLILAYLGLARLERRRGRLESALTQLQAALKLAPRDRWVRGEHAEVLRALGRLDEAAATLRSALAVNPRAAWAMTGLARVARAEGNRAAALAHLTRAAEIEPNAKEIWLEMAAEYREQGDLDAARVVVRRLLAERPDDGAALADLGFTERAAGNHQSALQLFLDAYAHNPGHHGLLIDIADEEHALGQVEGARVRLLRAAEEPAVAAPAMQRLAQHARAAGRYEEALEFAARACQADPQYPWATIVLAQLLGDVGRTDDGVALLRAAARHHAEEAIALAANESALLRRSGRLDEAGAAVGAALARSPASFWLWLERFEVVQAGGERESVQECLESMPAATAVERARVARAQGGVCEWQWRLDEAGAHYRSALEQMPDDPWAHEDLARVRLLCGDLGAAREHMAQSARLHAPLRLSQGLSANPSQSLLGQLIEEWRLQPDAAAELAALARQPPATARIEATAALVGRLPHYTPAAIALFVALRQAGWLALPAAPDETLAIPQRLAQLWSPTINPPDVESNLRSWQEVNPGLAYRLFNDESAIAFLEECCGPDVGRAYRLAAEPETRTDLLRLAWLFAEGGYFAACDSRCRRPLASAIPGGAHLVAVLQEHGALDTGLVGCVAQHPVIGLALGLATEAVLRGDQDFSWLATGAGLLTRAAARTLADPLLRTATWTARWAILDRRVAATAISLRCHVPDRKALSQRTELRFGDRLQEGSPSA